MSKSIALSAAVPKSSDSKLVSAPALASDGGMAAAKPPAAGDAISKSKSSAISVFGVVAGGSLSWGVPAPMAMEGADVLLAGAAA
ncbi:MAG: hypothetical protein HY082_04455 [Gammaproteobacteria bacterium]|nr:hypothetical protein [Gammaproteobacteria bacterium]